MSEVFLAAVNLSVAAGWLVAAVLLLRLLLRRAPRWICVLLWGVVALRLVCPFSPESVLSLVPSTQTVPMQIEMASTPAIDSGIGVIDAVVNPVIGQVYAPAPGDSANPLQITVGILWNIWILGAGAMLGYAAVTYARLRMRVCTAVRFPDGAWRSEHVDSPFVLGIFRPRIYLPYGTAEGDAPYVLAHERAHIRRLDPLWKLLGFLILAIYWFHPLLWLAYVLLCRDIEMACDEKVIANLDREARADYSRALVACSVRGRRVAACPLAFGEVGVRERIRSVLHYRRPALWLTALGLVLCAAVAVCFLTAPAASDSIVLADSDGPAGGNRLVYDVQLGDRVMSGEIYAEQWVYGECVRTAPVIMTHFVDSIEIVMRDRREDGAMVGTDVQISTNQYGGSLLTYFPHPTEERAIGWSFTGYGVREKKVPRPGEDMILAAMAFDTGSGVRAFDCDTLAAEPQRLRDASHMIVIRAVFSEDPLGATAEAEAESSLPREVLSLNDVIILSRKGYDLGWEDFEDYDYVETGSGLYIRVYDINSVYRLAIGGGGPRRDPMYMYLSLCADPNVYIDIRDGGVTEFLAAHRGEHAFTVDFAGNSSLGQSFTLTGEYDLWYMEVWNHGMETLSVEVAGEVWNIEPGTMERLRAEKPWEPGTYEVCFAGKGAIGMQGKATCGVYSASGE